MSDSKGGISRLPLSVFRRSENAMRKGALLLIRFYQMGISPMLPPSCRFEPSCSQYGYEAIAKYGIIKGGCLTTWRVLRCNPFNRGGYDPVH